MKKYIKIFILILILFLFNNKICFANTEYIKASLKENEEDINLIISMTGKTNIYGLLANIEYDQDKLVLNNCKSTNYDLTNENNKILLETLSLTKNTEILICNYTIIQEGNINDFTITNISLSNGEKLLSQDNIILKNKIREEIKQEEIVEEKEEIEEVIIEEQEEKEPTNWLLISIIIIEFIIIIILLVLYLKTKKKTIIPIILLLLTVFSQNLFIKTKAETKIDKTKVNEIRDMLLGIEFNNNTYDLDNDKKTTINDLILGLIEINKPIITYQNAKTTGNKEYKTSVISDVEFFSKTNIKEVYYCFTTEDNCIPNISYNYQNNNVKINYSDNLLSQKLCLKVINELGLETTTCDVKTYKVDSKKPEVTLKEKKVVISEEDTYKTYSNLNIKYGLSGGTETCTKDYKIGSNTITCIINGNNGLNTTISYELYVEETIDIIHFVDSLNPNYTTKFVSNDLTILESNGKFAIIDFGYKENEIDNKKVFDYLESLEIKEFEFAILTHGHSDHIGFFDDIVDKYPIKSIYMKEKVKAYKEADFYTGYGKILSTIEKYNIPIKDVEKVENQKIVLGDITLNLYNTTFLLNESDISKADNANSIATVATLHNKKIYFAGDIGEYGALREGLDVEVKTAKEIGVVDIYKVAHHGYMTYQNSLTALQYLNPTYSIVNNDEKSSQLDGLIDRLKFANNNYKNTYFTSSGHIKMQFNEDGTININQGY